MCGICGFTGGGEPESLQRMLALLVHRGPDDEGSHLSPEAMIGARRLSIIDVARGHQPTVNEDRTVIAVLNGEIYNHRELREMLEQRGHRFRSGTDTEVLPHLYEECGSAFPSLLRGMFAIAIWDADRRRLILTRDRLGEKPLVYAGLAGGAVAFSSEIRSLLAHPGLGFALDERMIPAYLTLGYVPAPDTLVRGVERLRPGHTLISDREGVRTRAYWQPAGSEVPYGIAPDDAPRHLRGLLEQAVRSQMEADVPVGALLSGGIDSAAIVALMAAVGPRAPKTFTVGFSEAGYDERAAASRVAQHVGADHTEVIVGPPTAEDLTALVAGFDEPIGDQAALPTLLVAREAKRHVTVVLTGEGSDELFAGYPRYRWFDRAMRVQTLPKLVRSGVKGALTPFTGPQREQQMRLIFAEQEWIHRYLEWVGIFRPSELPEVVSPGLRASIDGYGAPTLLRPIAQRFSTSTPVERTMLLDLLTWLPDDLMVKTDRTTMAVSLEGRAPFLDQSVVEFATALPATLRLGRRPAKWVLREAVADLLPRDVLGRPKQAFRVPVTAWLHDALDPVLREVLMAPNARTREFFRSDVIADLIERPRAGADRKLWAVGVLELWLRSFTGGV